MVMAVALEGEVAMHGTRLFDVLVIGTDRGRRQDALGVDDGHSPTNKRSRKRYFII